MSSAQELRRRASYARNLGDARNFRWAADEIERLKRRETDLLEANNRYLERARKAEWAESLKPEHLSDALDCFWNAAIGAAQVRQSEVAMDVASVMAQGFAEVAQRLRDTTPPETQKAVSFEAIVEAIDGEADLRDADGCVCNPARLERALTAARRVVSVLNMGPQS